jgi:hypothetical protein
LFQFVLPKAPKIGAKMAVGRKHSAEQPGVFLDVTSINTFWDANSEIQRLIIM